jgi:hypothetical protein
MSKLVRAGLEAVLTIAVTLAIIIGAFSALLGMSGLMALSGIYYVVWAAVILVIHLAFSMRRRHLRLSLSVGASVLVMAVHFALFLTGNISVDINVVPVLLHDFGFALVALVVLNIVHLVLFRRRQATPDAAPAAPVLSERVDDIPAPDTAERSSAAADEDVDHDEQQAQGQTQHAKSA